MSRFGTVCCVWLVAALLVAASADPSRYDRIEEGLQLACEVLTAGLRDVNEPSTCDIINGCQDAFSQVALGRQGQTCTHSLFARSDECGCNGTLAMIDGVSLLNPNETVPDLNSINCKLSTMAAEFALIAYAKNMTTIDGGLASGVQFAWPARAISPEIAGRTGCNDISGCSPPAPQRRNWFASAITDAKNVILLLETSSFMTEAAGSQARIAAKLVLDTLTDMDSVSIVTYATESESVPAHNGLLVPATPANLAYIRSWIDAIKFTTAEDVNLPAALSSAYSMLDITKEFNVSYACSDVFIVLSSGFYSSKLESDVYQVIYARNDSKTTRIFTYSFSDNQRDYRLLQRISCDHNGVYRYIRESSDITLFSTASNAYHFVLAATTSIRRAVWGSTSLVDVNGNAAASASKACYDESNKIIGVVRSLTVGLNQTEWDSYRLGMMCQPSTIDYATLEALRGELTCTPNLLPLYLGVGIPAVLAVIVIVLCLLHSVDLDSGALGTLVIVSPFLVPPLIILPWRFAFAIIGFRRSYSPGRALANLCKHFALLFLDLVTLPAAILVIITFYRLPSVIRKLQSKDKTWGLLHQTYVPHINFFRQAGLLVRDFLICFLGIPITLVAPWRFIMIIVYWTKVSTWADRVGIASGQLALAALDLITLPWFIPAWIIAPWRWPDFVRDVRTTAEAQTAQPFVIVRFMHGNNPAKFLSSPALHFAALKHLGRLSADIFLLPVIIVSLVMPHRFIAACFTASRGPSSLLLLFRIFATQAAMALLDIVSLPVILLISITLVRFPLDELRNAFHSNQTGKVLAPAQVHSKLSPLLRMTFAVSPYTYFWRKIPALMVDIIIFLPMLVMTLAVAPWRFFFIFLDILHSGSEGGTRRALIGGQLGMALVDLVSLPAALVVIVTGYRLPTSIKEIRNTSVAWSESICGYSTDIAVDEKGWWSDVGWAARYTLMVHTIVWAQFFMVLFDIVVLVLFFVSLVAPWRTFIIVIDFFSITNSRKTMRYAVVQQAILALLDLLTLPATTIVAITMFRVPAVFNNARRKCFDFDWSLSKTPLSFPGPLPKVNPPPENGVEAKETQPTETVPPRPNGTNKKPGMCHMEVNIGLRYSLYPHAAMWIECLVVVVAIPSVALLLAGPWRLAAFMLQWRKCRGYMPSFKIVINLLTQVGLLFADYLIILPLSLLILVTGYRVPSLYNKLKTLEFKLATRQGPIVCVLSAFGEILLDVCAIFATIICVAMLIPIVVLIAHKSPLTRPTSWVEYRLTMIKLAALAIPLWLAIPSAILSAILYPLWLLNKVWVIHLRLPKLLQTYLRLLSSKLIYRLEDMKSGIMRFPLLGPASIAVSAMMILELVSGIVSLFQFAAFVLVSFSWVSWLMKACGLRHMNRRINCSKWTLVWWMVWSPVVGFLHFVCVQLPRVVVLWDQFWRTIFLLCSPQDRIDGVCFDFYNMAVPEAPWIAIWIIWLAVYVHALPLQIKLIRKLIYKQVPQSVED